MRRDFAGAVALLPMTIDETSSRGSALRVPAARRSLLSRLCHTTPAARDAPK
jgi:hypothetical protein